MTKSNYIDQKWFLSELPWFPSNCAGLMILAGSADGNVGHVIADQSMLSDIGGDNDHMPNDDQLRETAAHIVEIHNAGLKSASESIFLSVHDNPEPIQGEQYLFRFKGMYGYSDKWLYEIAVWHEQIYFEEYAPVSALDNL